MNIQEVCTELDLPDDYAHRIWNSNSKGELFHVQDYYNILKVCLSPTQKKLMGWAIVQIVEWAEENWGRPESVFQHMPQMLLETYGTTGSSE